MTGRRVIRRKQLLDDRKEKRRSWKLKEETRYCSLWVNRFGRGYGPVVRQTTEGLIRFYTYTLGKRVIGFYSKLWVDIVSKFLTTSSKTTSVSLWHQTSCSEETLVYGLVCQSFHLITHLRWFTSAAERLS